MAVFFLPILQKCWSRCAASCTRVCVHLFSLLLSHRGNLGSSFSLFPLFLTLSLVSADPVNLFKAYAQSFVLSSIRSLSMCIHSFLPLDISTTTTIIIVVIIILSPVELCKKKSILENKKNASLFLDLEKTAQSKAMTRWKYDDNPSGVIPRN